MDGFTSALKKLSACSHGTCDITMTQSGDKIIVETGVQCCNG